MNRETADARCWAPLGRALAEYHKGEFSAQFTVHSDLWADEVTDVEEYYRPDHQELPELELRALTLCRGRVLDLGAGAGRHVLELQRRGLPVTALDVAPEAIEVMRERGVRDARCGSLEAVEGEKFDSILLLMHGVGVVGTLHGLADFLDAARRLLKENGQIVCDSADLATVMPTLLDGPSGGGEGDDSYYGEVEFRLSYGSQEGQPYPWLFVDFDTLARYGCAAGYSGKVEARGERAAYLARLELR